MSMPDDLPPFSYFWKYAYCSLSTVSLTSAISMQIEHGVMWKTLSAMKMGCD